MLKILTYGMVKDEKRNVSARFFANMLMHSKDYKKGRPIRLISCDTGSSDYGFAQKLANKLNVPVMAPTRKYLACDDGTYIVAGTYKKNGIEYVDERNMGYMRVFNPGGAYKK